MSVNNSKSQGAAAASAKHRGPNAEGSVRVLGQTAAVAGISGALLLALKALVLVSPAVLPDTDGLDALGRPNSIVDVNDGVQAPVFFAPASNPIAVPSIGHSERTALVDPARPSTIGKVAHETGDQAAGPKTPVGPTTPRTTSGAPKSAVGKVTKPVTDLVDGLVGTKLGKTVDGLGKTVETLPVVGKPVSDVLKTTTSTVAPVLAPVTGATGGSVANSSPSGVGSVVNTVTCTVKILGLCQ